MKINYFIILICCIYFLLGCDYDQAEKIATQTGFVEDGTKKITPATTDCTTFSAPTIPSSVSSGGLKTNLLIIRITFQGNINQTSIGDPFAQQSFKSNANCWANKIFGTGTGELNEYWQEVSDGKFMLYPATETYGTANDGIITVSLEGNHPNFGKGEVVSPKSAFSDAIGKADPFIDFSSFDSNSDGYLSSIELQVMFLVAGGETAYGDSPGIWAHKSCIYPAPQHDGYSIGKCGYQGYSTFGERQGNHDSTIGIIAHELGHAIFCFPDLYDISGSGSGIGNFGLMSGGSWGYKSGENMGATPVHPMAWTKYKSGGSLCYYSANKSDVIWETPDNISSTTNSVILYHTTHTSFNTKIVNISGKTKEYFMLENIGSKGYQAGLDKMLGGNDNTSGIAIWHIDDNKSVNSDYTHKLVDLEEANDAGLDGGSHSGKQTNLFYSGNNDNFSNSSTPNSKAYSGSASGITIDNISAAGESMTLKVTIE